MGTLSAEQGFSVLCANAILDAPQAHIDIELAQYADAFYELLNVTVDALFPIKQEGIGWKIVQLEILKGKVEKQQNNPRSSPDQKELF